MNTHHQSSSAKSSEGKIILHHKDVSPFSEKIRLLLGYTNMSWQAVQAPLTPPRPSIDPLVSGYRHIPVGQTGADVFCDTKIISDEIAHLSGMPELSPFSQPKHIREYLTHMESTVFLACCAGAPATGVLRALIQQVKLSAWPNYLKDKKYLFSVANMEVDRESSKVQWQEFLIDLNNRLKGDFLFEQNKPGIADFCAVHMIWFRIGMEGRKIMKGLENIERWYDRMIGFGHGRKQEITAEISLDIAQKTNPREIRSSLSRGEMIGKRVSIAPTDISTAATRGVVVGEDSNCLILARETETAGTVHIHFPKEGYTYTAV